MNEEEESKEPAAQVSEQIEDPEEFANLYQRLRYSFRDESKYPQSSLLDFHLNRLKAEFEESHSAAKLQPKHNKSALRT